MTTPHENAQQDQVGHVRPTGNGRRDGPVNFHKPDAPAGHSAHGGNSWMMIACCIPMLVIAVALVATGVASPSFLVVALACTAMMALMMRGMNHS